jgi:hypothetical protein
MRLSSLWHGNPSDDDLHILVKAPGSTRAATDPNLVGENLKTSGRGGGGTETPPWSKPVVVRPLVAQVEVNAESRCANQAVVAEKPLEGRSAAGK